MKLLITFLVISAGHESARKKKHTHSGLRARLTTSACPKTKKLCHSILNANMVLHGFVINLNFLKKHIKEHRFQLYSGDNLSKNLTATKTHCMLYRSVLVFSYSKVKSVSLPGYKTEHSQNFKMATKTRFGGLFY